jgi:hypothetical protein
MQICHLEIGKPDPRWLPELRRISLLITRTHPPIHTHPHIKYREQKNGCAFSESTIFTGELRDEHDNC